MYLEKVISAERIKERGRKLLLKERDKVVPCDLVASHGKGI
jgi:hypothetical protein